eukprot:SAG31_NODE_444_length_15625_cov_6.047469_4_plen_69_part_00
MLCAHAGTITSKGAYAWGGAAATVFWIDPIEKLCVIFMTQVMGYPLEPLVRFHLRQNLPVLMLCKNFD